MISEENFGIKKQEELTRPKEALREENKGIGEEGKKIHSGPGEGNVTQGSGVDRGMIIGGNLKWVFQAQLL